MRITGYTDRWAFRPGDTVTVRVSSEYPRYAARLVRHLGPIDTLADWDTALEPVPDVSLSPPEGTVRSIALGSSASAAFAPPVRVNRLELRLRPDLDRDMQVASLRFEQGDVTVGRAAGGDVRVNGRSTGARLQLGRWSRLSVTLADDTATVRVASEFDGSMSEGSVPSAAVGGLVELTLAPRFEGRMAVPALFDGADVVAAWAFGSDMAGLKVTNGPMLLLRSGGAANDAAAFHLDDLSDAGWPADFTFTLPAELRSGAYGILLSRSEAVDWSDRAGFDILPIFVAPTTRTARIAVVLPTFSYRAYGNSTFFEAANPEVFRLKHRSWSAPLHRYAEQHGLKSLYDTHASGDGVALATLKRPHLTTRADYVSLLQGFAHQYAADLAILGWLEQAGHHFDLLTDEVLHEDGVASLAGYDVVLTGSHPEYASPALLDAYSGYAAAGGSLMYLGGNGFYWSVGIDPDDPAIMEVRRRDGVRTWTGRAGEARHQTDGAEGGLWRNLDRAPNRLFGIGFAAHGYSGDGHYRINPSLDRTTLPPRLAAVLDEIGDAEFGVAGLELDAHQPLLGEPGPLQLLASVSRMPDGYVPAIEDYGALDAFLPDPNAALPGAVRGDIVLADLPGGGKVFSVGSIRWTSGLLDPADAHWVRRLTSAALDDLLGLADDAR